MRRILSVAAAAFLCVLQACTGDRIHVIRVSIADQKLALYRQGREVARYDVSTSKFGTGDLPGSNCTPLGELKVARKIGEGAPMGMKFKNRVPTGEIVPVNAPGRDPIVTRIMWLKGLQNCNASAFERMIYIHGTPEEWRIGTPASYGCIRMKSRDVVHLFDTVGEGAKVVIDPAPLPPPQVQTLAQEAP